MSNVPVGTVLREPNATGDWATIRVVGHVLTSDPNVVELSVLPATAHATPIVAEQDEIIRRWTEEVQAEEPAQEWATPVEEVAHVR